MADWVDGSVLQAASWRLASELVRRHPLTTRLMHTHPGGGQYDCLTITSSQGCPGTVQLNRHGKIQVQERFDGRPDQSWEPTEWDEYVKADPREFLDRLERASGLSTPDQVPATTATTLTYRVLATLAATSVKTVHPVDIQSGYYDTSGESAGPNELLDTFPIPNELRRPRHDDPYQEAGYRFWIVLRDGAALLAFEQTAGIVWTEHRQNGIDLMSLYSNSTRNVNITSLELLRFAETA